MSKAGRGNSSHCEPFRAVILAKLEQGLSATRVYQDLVAEHGFGAQYHSVRRFVRQLGQTSPLPFRRMECAPGEEAQIDFGRGVPPVSPDGKRRVPHVLRVGDTPMATTILDRFLHHAEVITITGRSYRLRQKAERADPPRASQPKKADETACEETCK